MQKTLFLSQGNGCSAHRCARQLYSACRDLQSQPTYLTTTPSRPTLLPFLQPLRGQAPLPLPLRRASSTLSAASPCAAAPQLESVEPEAPPSYCTTLQDLPLTRSAVPSNANRDHSLPQQDKKTMDAATELNKVALGHKGSTYQEYSVDSRMLGLEPAPFPASVLTPLTATTTLRARNRLSSQGREDKGSSINPPLSSSSHNDLESFRSVEHINTGSSLFRGTLFEYQTQSVLQRQLGIYTHRSAGNGDEGVDLRGKWFLPLSAAPAPEDWVRHLNVIVQCKKSTGKIGPRIVRELQGTLSYESQPTLAILASASDFTKQALVPCLKSLWPMALVVIDTELHECRKLMWNQAAEHVMHGLQIGTLRKQNNGRVVMSAGADAATGAAEGRPVLCFNGRILERLPGPLRPSEHGYVELTNSKVGGGVDKRFLRHEVQPASAPITHSVHTSLNAGTVDSTPEWDEDFLNHHPTENEQDRVNGVEYMSEDYTEYIRTLNNDNQLLVEADSEHEFSNVDWSWMEPMDKAHLADWLSVEPRSYEAEGERILHSIDLPTHMRPCTPT